MKRIAQAAGALAGLALLASTSAMAQERALFESVPGWQVEKSVGVAGNAQCVIVRAYVDEDDDDADNMVTFGLEGKSLVVAIRYSKWAFDKDDKFTAATLLGGKVANAKSTWTGNGTQLVGSLPSNLGDKAAASEELVLKGKDWTATFDLFGAEDAFDALKRCNAGEAPKARS